MSVAKGIPERTQAKKASVPLASDLLVVWRVNESCPLACRYCGFSRTLRRPRKYARLAEVLSFGRLLQDYQQQSGRSVFVSWLGGEPLLWPGLSQASTLFRKELGLRLGVTTNWIPLGRAKLRTLLCECFEQLIVSLDGLRNTHDRARGEPGLFDRVGANLAALRAEPDSASLLLGVNTILMRDNIDTFPEFCERMAAWGFSRLTFNQLGGRDRPDYYHDHRLMRRQVARLRGELPALRRRLSARGLEILGSELYLQRIAASTYGHCIAVTDCAPGERYLFVDAQGRVSPCSATSESCGVPIGELNSTRALAQLPARFRRRLERERPAACRDCQATHLFGKFETVTAPLPEQRGAVCGRAMG